jgi:hypothetical protein
MVMLRLRVVLYEDSILQTLSMITHKYDETTALIFLMKSSLILNTESAIQLQLILTASDWFNPSAVINIIFAITQENEDIIK